MVQGSWWQKESCCSHSYSMRKTRGQPMHRRKEETEERAVVERSDPEKGIFFFFPPLAFFCRYGQVGENASAKLLSIVSVTGLTVKEKLGGERECGTEPKTARQRARARQREGMGGPWFRTEGGEGRVIYVLRCSVAPAWFSCRKHKWSDTARTASMQTTCRRKEKIETRLSVWAERESCRESKVCDTIRQEWGQVYVLH